MQTLKDVKIEMYNNMKDRSNWFLSDGERYIVDNLLSEDGIEKYTEDKACDIVCQHLDGVDATDEENAFWEAGYIRGHEVTLQGILNEIESSNNKLITADRIKYLLNN